VAVFDTDEAFYRAMHELFKTMEAQTPSPIDKITAQKMVVRLRFSNPSAQIVVNGRFTPVRIQYGDPRQPSIAQPDLDAEMAADTIHLILLDSLSLKSALASKKIKVTGALWKTNSLAELLLNGRSLYPAIARQHGLI